MDETTFGQSSEWWSDNGNFDEYCKMRCGTRISARRSTLQLSLMAFGVEHLIRRKAESPIISLTYLFSNLFFISNVKSTLFD